MHCHIARRLHSLGIASQTTHPLRTALRVHLSACPSCRTDIISAEQHEFLTLLLTQPLPISTVPSSVAPMARPAATVLHLSRWAMSAGIVLGLALAFAPLAGTPTTSAADATGTVDVAVAAGQPRLMHRTSAAPVAAPVVRRSLAATSAVPRPHAIQYIALPEGMELALPPLDQQTPPGTYVVQRGDSLWAIASVSTAIRCYGPLFTITIRR
ncbi:MAG: LysM peptidoglycan-binding domain-containing protein [Chloroflexaceae bacterium]|nr:LysM peptidoglycan-binding domain-containing protein [Chloroflexaceae bacterium]